jgi:hypothetical protein
MVWDLGKALLKKEEFESSRLMDFEFRQRARATRLLAQSVGLDDAKLVGEIALCDEAGLIDRVAEETGKGSNELTRVYQQCLAKARQQLIVERGDPTPFRLG